MFNLYKIKYYCDNCNIYLYLKLDRHNYINKKAVKCPICDTINKRLELFKELQKPN